MVWPIPYPIMLQNKKYIIFYKVRLGPLVGLAYLSDFFKMRYSSVSRGLIRQVRPGLALISPWVTIRHSLGGFTPLTHPPGGL